MLSATASGVGTIPDVHLRTLKRAAEIVGGPQQLALLLKVTPSHLALWLAGREPVPTDIFLKAVDVVLAKDLQLPPP